MRPVLFLLVIVMTIGFMNSCSDRGRKQNEIHSLLPEEKVSVVYFHYNRRCAACNAVENVSRETLAEYYGNNVRFYDYNLDEKEGEAAGKAMGVSFQSLLIVSGETKTDITQEGFLYAQSDPEKLKQIIRGKIDTLLP